MDRANDQISELQSITTTTGKQMYNSNHHAGRDYLPATTAGPIARSTGMPCRIQRCSQNINGGFNRREDPRHDLSSYMGIDFNCFCKKILVNKNRREDMTNPATK